MIYLCILFALCLGTEDKTEQYLVHPSVCRMTGPAHSPFQSKFAIYCHLVLLLSIASILPFHPLNAELNPVCHMLTLLGAHPILHVSRIRVKVI
jgi:hypothetical protein